MQDSPFALHSPPPELDAALVPLADAPPLLAAPPLPVLDALLLLPLSLDWPPLPPGVLPPAWEEPPFAPLTCGEQPAQRRASAMVGTRRGDLDIT